MTKEVIARQIEPIIGQEAWRITEEEIIRCRDCRYLEEIEKETYYGIVVSWYECTELWESNEEHKEVDLDYFCCWGVKKDE